MGMKTRIFKRKCIRCHEEFETTNEDQYNCGNCYPKFCRKCGSPLEEEWRAVKICEPCYNEWREEQVKLSRTHVEREARELRDRLHDAKMEVERLTRHNEDLSKRVKKFETQNDVQTMRRTMEQALGDKHDLQALYIDWLKHFIVRMEKIRGSNRTLSGLTFSPTTKTHVDLISDTTEMALVDLRAHLEEMETKFRTKPVTVTWGHGVDLVKSLRNAEEGVKYFQDVANTRWKEVQSTNKMLRERTDKVIFLNDRVRTVAQKFIQYASLLKGFSAKLIKHNQLKGFDLHKPLGVVINALQQDQQWLVNNHQLCDVPDELYIPPLREDRSGVRILDFNSIYPHEWRSVSRPRPMVSDVFYDKNALTLPKTNRHLAKRRGTKPKLVETTYPHCDICGINLEEDTQFEQPHNSDNLCSRCYAIEHEAEVKRNRYQEITEAIDEVVRKKLEKQRQEKDHEEKVRRELEEAFDQLVHAEMRYFDMVGELLVPKMNSDSKIYDLAMEQRKNFKHFEVKFETLDKTTHILSIHKGKQSFEFIVHGGKKPDDITSVHSLELRAGNLKSIINAIRALGEKERE